MTGEEWDAGWMRPLGVRLDGNALGLLDEKGNHVSDDTLLILLQANPDSVCFAPG